MPKPQSTYGDSDVERGLLPSAQPVGRQVSYVVVEGLVGPESDGMRLDAYVAALDGAPSRSACARLVSQGCVRINGTVATSKAEHVLLGDRVAAQFPQEASAPGRLQPNHAIHLDICYEDEYLLVISKQAGLVCHPSPGHLNDTLANALVAHCGYEHLGMLQGENRPGIVHRLDMDTSGLMLAAKDDGTQRALQDLIRMRVLDRRYVTLVQGFVAPDEGTITTGIARSSRDRIRMTVSDDPLSREAITTFRTLERFEAGRQDDGYSLLECHLYTGRTHQIRVHMRHTGHAVVGDALYGVTARKGRSANRNLGLDRQFLHSWRLEFEHPVTGERLLFEDWLPKDLSDTLASLAPRSMGRTEVGDEVCGALISA